jgi:di/tricarboxylate transporter
MEQIIVFIVIAFILLSLYFGWMGTAMTFMVGVLALGLSGVLSPKEILSGFGNEQIWLIVVLLIIGDIIRKKGILNRFFNYVLNRKNDNPKMFRLRMMLAVAPLSSFLNNTPLVAILMPYVSNWGNRYNVPVSKLLIPLSYAAIMGGAITLIGTSTNLIVNGFVESQTIMEQPFSLSMFDFSLVGLPMLLLGIVYLFLFSDKLLPERKPPVEDISENPRKYIVDTVVTRKSSLIGKSIHAAGLRNLKGLFLAEIHKGAIDISPVLPSQIIEEGDILSFAGDTNTITNILTRIDGLEPVELGMYSKKNNTNMVEVVLSHNSEMVGKTIKEIGFRGQYDAVVIAVHRNGEKVSGKIGSIRLRSGDVLLLISGEDFNSRIKRITDFYILTSAPAYYKPQVLEGTVLVGGLLTAITLSVLNILPLFFGVSLTMLLAVAFKIAHPKDLMRGIDFDLIVIIALSLALGTAMTKTGAADIIVHGLLPLFKPLGVIGIMAGLYFVTTVLAAYITNLAAVALTFPVALSFAHSEGLNPVPFVLLVAFAAAANFMTPIGYQTNLMVFGPGGYKFKDYFKIGWPLTLMYMAGTVWILYSWYLK